MHDATAIMELERARQSLERRLSRAMDAVVCVSVTDNTRQIVSVRPAHAGVVRVRVHHMFVDHAPARVVTALVRWLAGGDERQRASSSSSSSSSSSPPSARIVDDYVASHAHVIKAVCPSRRAPRPAGRFHDLASVLEEVCCKFFSAGPGGCGGLLPSTVGITWGRRTHGPRASIRLGTYSARERLIRIHPVLDQAWIPRSFLACVVHHELLHHLLGHMHTDEFRAREREFPDLDRQLAWERRHITRLLRS